MTADKSCVLFCHHVFTSAVNLFLYSKKSGKIKTEFQQDYVHTNLDVDFNFTGPTVFGAAVIGYDLRDVLFNCLEAVAFYLNPAIFKIHSNLHIETMLMLTVCRYGGWLAGANVALDTSKTASTLVSQKNFALGYAKDDLTLHWAV
jgi:hypothetical protein